MFGLTAGFYKFTGFPVFIFFFVLNFVFAYVYSYKFLNITDKNFEENDVFSEGMMPSLMEFLITWIFSYTFIWVQTDSYAMICTRQHYDFFKPEQNERGKKKRNLKYVCVRAHILTASIQNIRWDDNNPFYEQFESLLLQKKKKTYGACIHLMVSQ